MRLKLIQISTYSEKGQGPKKSVFLEMSPTLSSDEYKRRLLKGVQEALDQYREWWLKDNADKQGEMF